MLLKDRNMWQPVEQFLQEWIRTCSWIPSAGGVLGGFLLYLIGLIWKVPRDKKLGLVAMGAGIVASVILYFLG
jgi:hypothetical protein